MRDKRLQPNLWSTRGSGAASRLPRARWPSRRWRRWGTGPIAVPGTQAQTQPKRSSRPNPSPVATEAKTKLVEFENAPFPFDSGTDPRKRRTASLENERYSDPRVLLHIPQGFDIRKPRRDRDLLPRPSREPQARRARPAARRRPDLAVAGERGAGGAAIRRQRIGFERRQFLDAGPVHAVPQRGLGAARDPARLPRHWRATSTSSTW